MSEETIGQLVKRLREARGLTQGQVATYSGLGRPWVAQLESGRIDRPDREKLESLAIVLHVPPENLLAAAGYRTQPLPERRRTVDEIARELLAAQAEAPIMVPETRQPASAGAGVQADAELWPYIPLPGERQHRHIAVEVVGDCLVPKLLPGQRAIVNLDASPRPGDIVLAVHDGEAILKVLEERDGALWLVALQHRPPRQVDASTRILGVARAYTGRL